MRRNVYDSLMRIAITIIALAIAVPARAFADESIAGTYNIKLDQTASTCDPKPETFSKSKAVIAVKRNALTIKIDAVYQMVGAAPKGGTFSAKTEKLVGTSIGGLSARYSVAGHVDANTLELVLTAQYIRQDTNKPHCAQAWNVTGTRVTEASKP